ncbi:hypothetical protein AAJP84_04330 [Bartonella schoenbuchensis]|uniref:hypothetical protein n=1 Tax=Bartonella schoenbuchensis TaxID=165694 RepID=UPI0031CCC8C9
MVMRRVFNHHVCLCVLSTAILAGLALMTSQNKVYAQAKNCEGVDSGRENQPIVCDGTTDGRGWGNGTGATNGEWGVLSGKRDIDMSEHSGQAAVTVYNKSGRETAKITISSKLTVTDSRSSSQMPAIKVYQQGELKLVGDVNVTGVKKGIVVEGPGSSVTVMTGSIEVRAKGGPVIEVKNNGKAVLMEEVKVTGSGSRDGVGVLIENGGEVTLMKGVTMKNVKTGMKIMGTTGIATVRGGATITVGQNGTGLEVEGNANVVELEIKGNGGNGMGVLINGSGTVVMTKVTMKDVITGARVSGGVLRMIGDSTINVAESGTGFNVTGGKVVMEGGSITVGVGGKGMNVWGGRLLW